MAVGNLESVRDFLDVSDVVEAYRLLLEPSIPADVYNVCSGTPVSVQTLLDTLLDLAGVQPTIEANPDFFRPNPSGRLIARSGVTFASVADKQSRAAAALAFYSQQTSA